METIRLKSMSVAESYRDESGVIHGLMNRAGLRINALVVLRLVVASALGERRSAVRQSAI